MNIEQVKEIANAVLYEGYLLYPYRQSAIKNRQRWSFGVVYPREYSEANGDIEPWTMQTECLVEGDENTSINVYVRFLHLLLRQNQPTETNELRTVGYDVPTVWEEGVEREVSVLNLALHDLIAQPRRVEIAFAGDQTVERVQQPIQGAFLLRAQRVDNTIFKLSIVIENTTPGTSTVANLHNAILLHSFASTHTLLQVHRGAFISLLDPPSALKDAAQGCQNLRTWPVMVGSEGDTDAMLSSPIILYDYPQIAQESPGPLFDGTEIDEILTLRIMTLTDAEKQEIRQGDERAREILERTENLTAEEFMKLHGTIRSLRPVGEGGREHE